MQTEGNQTASPCTADDLLDERPRPRPLLPLVLGLIVGVWLSDSLGPVGRTVGVSTLVVGCMAVALLFVRRWSMRREVLPLLLFVAGSAAGFIRYQQTLVHPPHHIAHALTEAPVLTRVAGRIITAPTEHAAVRHNPFCPHDPPARTRFALALDELRTSAAPTPAAGTLYVHVEATGLHLELGQRVQVTGHIYRPRGPRNPGERDWSQWYRRQGLDAGMRVEDAAHVRLLPGRMSAWHRLIGALRTRARGLLLEPYADLEADASTRLIDVMVLGQRSAADQALNEAFLRAGGMHFLAVSGFHVGALAMVVYWFVHRLLSLANRWRRWRRLSATHGAALAVIAGTLLYALIVEPNAPVLRAATLVIAGALALMMRRPFCVINWLALAAGILVYNPQELFRPGFQLSFVQVLGLVLIVPPLYRRIVRRPAHDAPRSDAGTFAGLVWLKVRRWVAGLALLCVCAWVTALPLVLFHFERFAPWGWLGTFLLSPLVLSAIALSFLTAVGNALHPACGALPGAALRWLIEILLDTVGRFSGLPGSVVESRAPPAWLVLASYAVLLTLAAVLSGRRSPANARPVVRTRRSLLSMPAAATCSAMALLVLAWVGWLVLPPGVHRSGCALHVLAVGDGSAALLTGPDGRDVVCDVGTIANRDVGETAARALRALGVRRLDGALISHANFDHYSGLPTLLRHFPIKHWMASPYMIPRGIVEGPVETLVALLPKGVADPQVVCAGDRLTLGSAALEVLWPPPGLGKSWQANDRSLVLRLEFAGRSMLLTGDVDREALKALLAAHRAGRIDLRADVLLAPHHGAVVDEMTAGFYAAVAPRAVVVSARRRRPRLEALTSEIVGPECQVLTTGAVGAVTVHITPDGGLAIETPFAAEPVVHQLYKPVGLRFDTSARNRGNPVTRR